MDVYLCGASLIAPEVVLTSGHCVNDSSVLSGKLEVRCGEWDTSGETEELPSQQISVQSIVVSTTRPNDL